MVVQQAAPSGAAFDDLPKPSGAGARRDASLMRVSTAQLEVWIEVVVDPDAPNDRARNVAVRRVHPNPWRGATIGAALIGVT